MVTTKKLLTVFAALTLLCIHTVRADSCINNMYSPLCLSWNASSSLDLDLSELDGFDDLGQKIQVRDLNLSADALIGIFGARILLEENNDQLKIDATDLESKIKELYVGIQPTTNMIILFGRKEIPFGSAATRRAIDRNDPLHRANEQLERYMVASVEVKPTFMKEIIQSVELAGFSSQKNPEVDFGDIADMDSYSIRLKGQIGKVLTQASYMSLDGEEKRGSVFGAVVLGRFNVYSEIQLVRDSAVDGDTDAWLVGAQTSVGKAKVFAEATRVNSSQDTSISKKGTQYNGTVGATYPVNRYVDVGAEVTTNVKDIEDTTVLATMSVHRAAKPATNAPLFPETKKKQELAKANGKRM